MPEPAPHLGPESPSASVAAREAGRLLFAAECRFVAAAGASAAFPSLRAPEVAFIGRSNVGKSSLLNALVGRTRLARVSGTPGRTRELIFFTLADRLTLVDLPGYGFAKASKELAAAWRRVTRAYLRERPNLRRVLLLLDARRGVGGADGAAMELLDAAAVTFQLILTKIDVLPSSEAAARCSAARTIARAHPAAYPEVLATSARSGAGIEELRADLAGLAA